MKLENRYLVLKWSDIDSLGEIMKGELQRIADTINAHRYMRGSDPINGVVIESDWPEYQTFVELLKNRIKAETDQGELKEGPPESPTSYHLAMNTLVDRYHTMIVTYCHTVGEPHPTAMQMSPGRERNPNHLLWMLSQIVTLPILKGQRWLAFVQATLISMGATSVQIERDATRDLLSPLDDCVSIST